jgi:RNA polymerase sigma-70 factor (ECF subfamily)
VDQSELIARIRQNDVDALAAYLEQHRPRMIGLLRVMAGQHLMQVMELDDLFQEVSTSAIGALAKIPKDENFDVDAWLEQLARRRVVDAHRRFFGAQKRSAAQQRNFSQMQDATSAAANLEQLLIASMTSPSMAVNRDMRLAKVQSAMSRLSEEQQNVLRLRFVENLTTREIAERISKTDVAVRVMLSRTIKLLEEQLRDPSDTSSGC